MPKIKSKPDLNLYKITKVYHGRWKIKVDHLEHYTSDGIELRITQILCNEAYAHGYRNGLRKGRKG